MDKNNETGRETKDKLIKKEMEEAALLEKELAKERREEVSRIVDDLQQKTEAEEKRKASSDKKEKKDWKTETPQERERRAEEVLRKVNQRQQEEAKRTLGEQPAETLKSSRRRKKGSGKRTAAAAGIFAATVVAAAGAYFLIGMKYRTSFLPGTVINGNDVSGMTPAEVENLISEGIESYQLVLKERGDKTESIAGGDIRLEAEFDGTLEKIVENQNPNTWLMAKWSGNSYDIETMISYDEMMLAEKIGNLECMDEEKVIKPVDAYISEYVSGQGYSIVPEEEGNELNSDVVREKVGEAIQALRTEISLEEEGCYKNPVVRSDNDQLKERIDNLNRYVNVTVTYKFGDKREVLNGDIIHEWIAQGDGSGDISLDGVKSYVQTLATKYNTAYRAKNLKTSYGKEVTITRGNYGWRIDQAAEVEQLMAVIRSGESQEREPVYAQTAASHGENDYGNTYVEINLTAQHLFFYKEGKLLVESDFVSGNVSRGFTTPPGAYPLTYKERNATLKGQGYSSPVSYWMPFNGGIGMHDASWRSSFGGSIYKTNGSHGCINLPYSAAKTIYENIAKGMPVLCYNMGGTEKPTLPATAPAETPASEETSAAQETTQAQETPDSLQKPEPPKTPAETPAVQPTEPVEPPKGPGDVLGQTEKEPDGPGVGL